VEKRRLNKKSVYGSQSVSRSTALDPWHLFETNCCVSRIQSGFVQLKKKVKFTLEEAMKAQRGNRGAALLFL
jgi:hypothetical protein